jgi:hypothetical protein
MHCPFHPQSNGKDKFCTLPTQEELDSAQQWFDEMDLEHVANMAATDSDLLRTALMSPHQLKGAMPPDASFQIIWDSGASHCITNDKKDFVGPLKSTKGFQKLSGLAKGIQIKGAGHVEWTMIDTTGGYRTLRLPALYVPDSPVKLLSTTQVCQLYPGEKIQLDDSSATLTGIKGDPTRHPVMALVNPSNNIPHNTAFRLKEAKEAAVALNVSTTTVHPKNINLSEPEKELLRWHQRFGHLDFRKVQFLLRSGVLSLTPSKKALHARAAKIVHPPQCTACNFGKQTVRPSKTPRRTAAVTDNIGVLKDNKLFPGQSISVDHFVCSTKGVIPGTRGGAGSPTYVGGCIMVDAASGLVHVEHQQHLNTHETLDGLKKFESMCMDVGVVPMEYVSDSGSAFTSKDFQEHLAQYRQIIHFAGTGAHHHNSIAERSIRTIMSIARTSMLHAAIHWPDMADATLWPLAVDYAVHIFNRIPNRETGLSPLDLFTGTRQPLRRLHDLHVWGSPAYLLDKRIADGKKIPRWEARSERVIFVGISTKHMGSTPLVLNPRTRAITSPYHVVFDDWFATVGSDPDHLPDFQSPEWQQLFGESDYQYVEDEDWMHHHDAPTPQHQRLMDRREQIGMRLGPQYQYQPDWPPLPPPPPLSLAPIHPPAHAQQPPPAPIAVQRETTAQARPQAQRLVDPAQQQVRIQAPTWTQQPSAGDSQRDPAQMPTEPRANESNSERSTPTAPAEPPTQPPVEQHPEPTQRTRDRSLRYLQQEVDSSNIVTGRRTRTGAPSRLTYTTDRRRWQSGITQVEGNTVTMEDNVQYHFPLAYAYHIMEETMTPEIYKASKSDPDTMTLEEALKDVENHDKWVAALEKEIRELESHGAWEEVPVEDAKSDIVPTHWVMKIKRRPDGSFDKFKSRIVVRGDLMKGYDFETHAPTCAWSTIRMVMILALTWEWHTCTCDFQNAFIQAHLTTPVWIQLPRGYRSTLPGRSCLRLKRSLYGTNFAPKLWSDTLVNGLKSYGLIQSEHDKCLFSKPGLMAVCWVDDLVLAYKDPTERDRFLEAMKKEGFSLSLDDSLEAFLGIKFKKLGDNSFNMTQPALIEKVIQATGMENCNKSPTPAAPNQALGKDPDGEPMAEQWSYPSVVGMLQYLSTNTRPDICFAVSQVARFTHDPKQSHATAVKRIVRYLKGTPKQGTIMRPNGTLALNSMSDADFAGLYNVDPVDDVSSAQSRMGYIITLGGCNLVWKSQLISSVCMATAEAEYYSLSHCLRTLIPIRRVLEELCANLEVPQEIRATISSTAFEDNSAALNLARNHRLTSRTRYYHAHSHHFWQHVDDGTIVPQPIETALMDADYLTKAMPREGFEANRKRVQGW